MIPDWPPGTVAILATRRPARDPGLDGACAPGPIAVLLALGPSRGSLARLREDPRCALAVIAEGVAVTLRGRATVVGEAAGTVAVRLDVEAVDDHVAADVRDRRGRALGAGPTRRPRARDAEVRAARH